MRILHVITGLRKAAGTTTFVENVVREQRILGHTVEVLTNDGWSGNFDFEKSDSDSSLHLPTTNCQLSTTLFHLHGLWSPLLHTAVRYARNHKIPIVWSTHGMTAPWSLHHKWWKKVLPWYLYQLPDLKRAALIHCTTELEETWNQALGLMNTFIAPLGTNLPEMRENVFTVNLQRQPRPRTLLYIGRVYPVKALDNAIRAVALMKQPIILRIVGPDQAGHMAELMSLCESLHLPYTKPGEVVPRPIPNPQSPIPSQVQFIGPKYDDELDREYWACDALILVSHTENFGATVVDAMAHGKPVITSTKTPWKIVADKGCGWWVDNAPDSLAKVFDEFATTSISGLNLLGQRGLALVQAEYTWPAIACNLISHYAKLIPNDNDCK